tara:strand:- start:33224 stop:34222 length:999 start_codon:yes stop_codon:yes gene_type:complete
LRYVLLLGVLFLFLFVARAGEAPLFGFHTELIEGGTATAVAANVTERPGGVLDRTLGRLLGDSNEAGLLVEDVVWVKDGLRWRRFYYDGGWRGYGYGDEDQSRYRLPAGSGFFIQSSRESDWLLFFGGFVRRGSIAHDVSPGFNVLNRGFPAPVSLLGSGLAESPGFGAGDFVWIYRDGEYGRYYLTDYGWRKVGGNSADFGHVELGSAVIIQTVGSGGRIVLRPPRQLRRSKVIIPERTFAPPAPDVDVGLAQNTWGSPVFEISWLAAGSKVVYTTEVIEEGEWLTINERSGWWGQRLSDHAVLVTSSGRIGLRWGVARVTANWREVDFGK